MEMDPLVATDDMASWPMIMEQTRFDWHRLRPVAPLLIFPAGILFCLAHALLPYGQLYGVGAMFKWSVLVLSPWAVTAMLFERSVRVGETRLQLLLRAAVLALIAYAISSCGSFWLGAGVERAFLSRMPLVAGALLLAGLYPLKPLPAKGFDARQSGEEELPVEPSHVLYAAGAGNYVELHCGSRTILWRQTLRNAEEVLRPEGFVRIHRSRLVNRERVREVRWENRGEMFVVMANGVVLKVARSCRTKLDLRTKIR